MPSAGPASRASTAPTAIEPTAKPIITIEKPPAPSCSESADEGRHAGDPAAGRDRHRERRMRPRRRTSIRRGRSASNPSRSRGDSPCAARPRPALSRRISERRDEERAPHRRRRTMLSGENASRSAASAQPPTESAWAVAWTSAFACWTFSRSTTCRDRRAVGGREVARGALEDERGDDEPPQRQRARRARRPRPGSASTLAAEVGAAPISRARAPAVGGDPACWSSKISERDAVGSRTATTPSGPARTSSATHISAM